VFVDRRGARRGIVTAIGLFLIVGLVGWLALVVLSVAFVVSAAHS
jgi:hypothetical protein